ncbi:RNA-directed DNA polymerase, eukaryota, reverse transcriptase zinc-binding domain protein [Tanacetum coccineum]
MLKVLFNEEIVSKGCAKWKYTICGQFIGQNMSYFELRYHARRMWERYGLIEVIVNSVNLFTFKDEKGINYVLEQGPWLIRSRPMFDQKWDPKIGMIKAEPKVLPIWINMMNIPMEAWSMEGISALASSLGTKEIEVMYDSKPDVCQHFSVFGHSLDKCLKRPRTEEEIKAKNDAEQKGRDESMANKKEGFTEVHNRRKFPPNQNKNWQQKVYNGNGNRQEYKKKNVTNGGPQVASTSKPQGDKGKENQVDKMNRGTNQFDVLKEINASEEVELGALKWKPLVDVYPRKKFQPTCAEILVSWNNNKVDVNVLFSSRQTMLCLIETILSKTRVFCSFVYAANSRSERKELWKDLQRAKRISSGWPWLLTSDFNVTMKNEEHSNGGSKNSVLKKLDRAMVNEELMNQFCNANALFLPYLVSDHSLVVVNFPQTFVKKKKAFRFANFITERDTFLPTIAAGWEVKFHGHKMYQLVQKMKGLKYSLKSISWKNGNMAEYVDKCRNDLKIAQGSLDKEPHNQYLKTKKVDAQDKYNKATKEEESFLFQKAKVD